MQRDPQITAFKKVTEGQGARMLRKVASMFLTHYIVQGQGEKEDREKDLLTHRATVAAGKFADPDGGNYSSCVDYSHYLCEAETV